MAETIIKVGMDVSDVVKESAKASQALSGMTASVAKNVDNAAKSAANTTSSFASKFEEIGVKMQTMLNFGWFGVFRNVISDVLSIFQRIYGVIQQSAKAMGDLADNAKKAGTSAENIQLLNMLGEQAGVSPDRIISIFEKLNTLVNKSKLDGKNQKELSALGISFDATKEENLISFINTMAGVKEGEMKALIASDLLGKSFEELFVVIEALNGKSLKELRKNLNFGDIISEEAIKGGDKIDKQFNSIGRRVGNTFKTGIVAAWESIDWSTLTGGILGVINTYNKTILNLFKLQPKDTGLKDPNLKPHKYSQQANEERLAKRQAEEARQAQLELERKQNTAFGKAMSGNDTAGIFEKIKNAFERRKELEKEKTKMLEEEYKHRQKLLEDEADEEYKIEEKRLKDRIKRAEDTLKEIGKQKEKQKENIVDFKSNRADLMNLLSISNINADEIRKIGGSIGTGRQSRTDEYYTKMLDLQNKNLQLIKENRDLSIKIENNTRALENF